MQNDILGYIDMCQREGVGSLQAGMNFQRHPNYSIVLMSRRHNAPYEDRILQDGKTIEYEGHDSRKTPKQDNPKSVDQPRFFASGKPTQNGLFAEAIGAYKQGKTKPEPVKVYEKIFPGIWSDKGMFELVDYKFIKSKQRKVFKFYLRATGINSVEQQSHTNLPNQRLIPSRVKKEVWKRDKGQCVICGETTHLHFDHDIPWSKGGSSITPDNVKILCARHNLQKSAKIE